MPGRRRQVADSDRTARLLRHLEERLRPVLGDGCDDPPRGGGEGRARHSGGTARPLVVTKSALHRVLTCGSHVPLDDGPRHRPTRALATGAVVDAAFRQLVTVGSIEDPVADGLAALRVGGGSDDLLSWVSEMPDLEWSRLVADVEEQVEGLRRRWPPLDPTWMPRTQEPMRVPVAGGAVELVARVDLSVGVPGGETATVALLDLKSGIWRPEHGADLRFAALIEALRHPAPPFVIASYYARTGELDVEWVDDEALFAAAERTAAGVRRLIEERSGAPEPLDPALCLECRSSPAPGVGEGFDRPGDPGTAVREGRAAAAVRRADRSW